MVLSEDMAQRDDRRAERCRRGPVVINNFDPWVLDDGPRSRDDAEQDGTELTVVFAGNIGAFQGLEVVFERRADA